MRKIILTSVLSVLVFVANAQVDTINAANNKLQLKNLREGKSIYAVYMSDTLLNKRNVGGIWERTTTLKTLNNKSVIEFKWRNLFGDTLHSTITNICDAKTLAPIYHFTDNKSRGVKAYNFIDGFMVPTDSVKNNKAIERGKVALSIPIISWELDLETYPLLPIKKVGQKFDISFFDPNEKEPKYHRYEVIGKEDLQLNNDTKVKCWLLKINYTKDSYATFWLTEKSKDVIKMQEYYKGGYRFKVKQY
jgi:hypothetical protein